MLNKDFVEQQQMKKQVHNILENKLQEIGLGETQFVNNILRMRNSSTVSKTKHFL